MAQTNVQAFSGDVEISGETILGTATYRKKIRWNRNALAYVYLGNIQTNNTTGIRLDVAVNAGNSGYEMYQFQITLSGNDDSHAGGKMIYSALGGDTGSNLKEVDIGYVYVGSGGSYEYQLWLKDPTTDNTGAMDAYLNCQGYYDFDTGVSDVAQGGAAPTNFNLGTPGVVVDKFGNVGIGTNDPRAKMDIYTGSTSTAGIILDRYATGNYRSELYQASNGLSIHVGNASNAPSEKLLIHHDGTVTASTFSGDLDGNADTATTLETARTINGVSFNGSANINVDPYISDDNSGDTSCHIVFTQNSTAGYKRLYEDNGLSYDNTNNRLYSGAIASSEGGCGMSGFQIKIRQTDNVNYYQACGYLYNGSHKVFMTAIPSNDGAFGNNHFSGLINKGRYGPANWTDGLSLGFSRYDNSLGTYPNINWYVQNQGNHGRVTIFVSLYNAATNNNAFYFNVGAVGLESYTLTKSYTNQW